VILYQWTFEKPLGTNQQKGTVTSAQLLINDTGSNNISFIIGERITVNTGRALDTANHNGTYYLHNYRIADSTQGQLGEMTVSCSPLSQTTLTPTPTATPTATLRSTTTPTATLRATTTPTNSITPTKTATPTTTKTPITTVTPTLTATPTKSVTPTKTTTPTSTLQRTATPTLTVTPTKTTASLTCPPIDSWNDNQSYQRITGMSIVGLTSGAIRTSSTRAPIPYQWTFIKLLGPSPQEGTITSPELLVNDAGSNNISFIIGERITVYTTTMNNHNGTYYLHNYRIVDSPDGQLGEITVSCNPSSGGSAFPAAPSNLVVLEGNEAIDLSWDAPVSIRPGDTLYGVAYRVRGTANWLYGGSYNNLNNRRRVIVGLINNTEYEIKVGTIPSSGGFDNVVWSVPIFATPTAQNIPPTPFNLIALEGNEAIDLSWDAPVSIRPGDTLYGVAYRVKGATNWLYVGSYNNLDNRRKLIVGLINNTEYEIKVGTIPGSGGFASVVWSLSIFATPRSGGGGGSSPITGTPGNIDSIIVTDTSRSSVMVSWTVPVSAGSSEITDYILEYSSNNKASWTTASRPAGTSTKADINNLGTAVYFFRVAAVNKVGRGQYSTTSDGHAKPSKVIIPTTKPDPETNIFMLLLGKTNDLYLDEDTKGFDEQNNLPQIYSATNGGSGTNKITLVGNPTVRNRWRLLDGNIINGFFNIEDIEIGMLVSGAGIPTNTRVEAVNIQSKIITLNQALGAGAPNSPSPVTFTPTVENNFYQSIYATDTAVYAGTNNGLKISTLDGLGWNTFTTVNGLGNNVVRDVYVIDATIYAATNGGLSISNDNGLNWTNFTTANGLSSSVVKKVFVDNNKIYVATANGVSISNNNGLNWTNFTTVNGLGSNEIRDIQIINNKIYAATSAGVSISNDGGLTWTNSTTSNGLGSNSIQKIYYVQNTIYAATDNGLSISTNNGSTWVNRNEYDGLDGNKVINVYAKNNIVYALTEKGFYISSDLGNNWRYKGFGSSYNSISNSKIKDFKVISAETTEIPRLTFYKGSSTSYGGQVQISYDTGKTWKSTVLSSIKTFKVIDNSIFAITDKNLLLSNDGGESFNSYSTPGTLNSNLFIDKTKICISSLNGLHISTDSGVSFTTKTISDGLGSNIVRDVYASGNTIYAATSNGLSFSTNNGLTFDNILSDSSNPNDYSLSSNNIRRVYLDAVRRRLYIQNDKGIQVNDGPLDENGIPLLTLAPPLNGSLQTELLRWSSLSTYIGEAQAVYFYSEKWSGPYEFSPSGYLPYNGVRGLGRPQPVPPLIPLIRATAVDPLYPFDPKDAEKYIAEYVTDYPPPMTDPVPAKSIIPINVRCYKPSTGLLSAEVSWSTDNFNDVKSYFIEYKNITLESNWTRHSSNIPKSTNVSNEGSSVIVPITSLHQYIFRVGATNARGQSFVQESNILNP
jgi:photosystem II stability/assembly factor-like uncharacterized protein